MWSTRREIGGVIYMTGAILLALGSRLAPIWIDGAVGGIILIYTLVGAALVYRSLERRLPMWQAVALTLAMGTVVYLLFYFAAGMFTASV